LPFQVASALQRLADYSDNGELFRATLRRRSETFFAGDQKRKLFPGGYNDPDRCNSGSN
jgi:hypothetical protein